MHCRTTASLFELITDGPQTGVVHSISLIPQWPWCVERETHCKDGHDMSISGPTFWTDQLFQLGLQHSERLHHPWADVENPMHSRLRTLAKLEAFTNPSSLFLYQVHGRRKLSYRKLINPVWGHGSGRVSWFRYKTSRVAHKTRHEQCSHQCTMVRIERRRSPTVLIRRLRNVAVRLAWIRAPAPEPADGGEDHISRALVQHVDW